MIITSTGTTFYKSQNICKQHLPYINVYQNITIPHHYYFHYKLIQNPCYQPPPHGYHQHLQHGLGQHLQHDDRDAGFPSEIQGLLKSLLSNENTCFFFLIGLKSIAPLASIQSHPFHPSCTPHHSSVKSQTVSSPAMSIPTHVLTLPRTILSTKIKKPTPPALPSSKIFLMCLRVLLVPCGKHIVVTSSHVNVSDHNPRHLYGTYGRIRVSDPVCRPAITLQLLIVEVWLYIVFFFKF
jgi:hypothetical protein